jgi:DNA polymerase III alpha subunit
MAAEHGVTSLALTNINSTCDTWDFVKYCREEKIKPVVGVEIRNGHLLLYILLAANNEGLRWIHEFLSTHLMDGIDFPEVCPEFSNGFIIYPMGRKAVELLATNERIGVCYWELTKLFGIDMRLHGEKFVIRQPVTVQNKLYFNLHRLLCCIDKNILLSKYEPMAQASPGEVFLSPTELLEHFRHYPFMVTNTYKLMDSCTIEMEFYQDKTKKTFGGSREDDRILLEKLATDGFQSRYGKKNKIAKERLAKELKIISELGFNAYFLINWDIIRYAQSRGFYYVGRGSGANSIVAYCLKITDVDPIELNLYFERFLNPHRTSPPDFDIDFSYTDRDEVMDYVFKRYGKQYVSLLGAYSTFQHDAIIQQLGKIFGLPKEEYVQLQKSGVATDNIQALILKYGKLLYDFPNILTVHACGMLISEKPILEHASLFMPPKGFPTVQMDMFVAENIGLNKFDILSQRGLGHIKESLRLIKLNKGVDIDIHNAEKLKRDPGIAKQIREANTIGCFYIESPAMRGLLKKLKCDDYLTLVAASSIIRPGVAQSGMMRAYIERYHDRSKVEYLHPIMKELLEETFGVMVFQEDVIKVAHYFAGLDLGQADILRRAMCSTKYRANNSFEMIRENYFNSCRAQGHDDALSAEIWRQMESFAGYSFNKAHSASFAVESYMSLYLKTYFPKEFMVAVINNFGGFYSTELYFLELLKTGGEIKAPCINNSDYYTNIKGNEVYTGLVHIKSLKKVLEVILEERSANGPYLHLQDFIERVNPGEKQVDTLISVGAFRFTGKSKKTLLWEANFLNKKNKPDLHSAPVLFKDAPVEFNMPELIDLRLDDLYDEMEILGFTMSNPFDMVDDDPAKYVLSKDLEKHVNKYVTVLAYFIARKHVTTKNDTQMFFGTFVDSNLDWIDTVHFPEAAKNHPLHSSGFYRISGKVTDDFGVYSLEVKMMHKVGYKQRKYSNL